MPASSPALFVIAQDAFPCWARAATGIVLAAIAWGGLVGIKAAVRYYQDGRVRAAGVTVALSAVGVVGGFVLFWLGLNLVF